MHSVRKPWWQQATALVTVSTGGVITGFNFVPGAAATMTSPTSVPVHLLALEQAGHPRTTGELTAGADSAASVSQDAQLRAAVVNVAKYYLQQARSRTPAQMEALIWDKASSDGADHGASCAAFASLTLELAAQAVGQQSWVSGGSSYPWPLHDWADVRVDTNPASPAITSVVADAQRHGRWHPLGDGYQPQPGDWVLFNGHIEVVTGYAGGVLDTIGADSLPGLTVNAHAFTAPLADHGVAGFVDNGQLKAAPTAGASGSGASGSGASGSGAGQATPKAAPSAGTAGRSAGTADRSAVDRSSIPGLVTPGSLFAQGGSGQKGSPGAGGSGPGAPSGGHAAASVPGLSAGRTVPAVTGAGLAVVPGWTGAGRGSTPEGTSGSPKAPAAAPRPPAVAPSTPAAKPAAPASTPASSPGRQYATPGTRDQQSFINLVAPGAIAAQHRYGVPAAVTIAQAIEESAWGRSSLAAKYHNLFGVKGDGPAGSVSLPTSEFLGGHWVTVDAAFRVYHNDAESIADHAELLATSVYYTRAMADRAVPDAFANDLTGVYATDPHYGGNLIDLMKLYNLYRFGSGAGPAAQDTGHPAPDGGHPAPASGKPAATPATPPAITPATATPATPPASQPTTSPTGWHPAVTPTATPSGAQRSATPTATPSGGVPAVGATATPSGGQSATGPTGTDGGGQGPPSGGRQAAVPGVGPAGGAVVQPGAVQPGAVRPGAARARVPGVAAPALAPSATPVTAAADAAGGSPGTRPRIPGAVSPGTLYPRAGGTTAAAGAGTPGGTGTRGASNRLPAAAPRATATGIRAATAAIRTQRTPAPARCLAAPG